MAEHRDLLLDILNQTKGIYAHMSKKAPEQAYMFEFMLNMWQEYYDARENGIPIVLCEPLSVPQEMIYALGAIPLGMESLPIRIASQPTASTYIDYGETIVSQTFCGLNKSDLGIALSRDLRLKPAAFIYQAQPCDSGRAVFGPMADMFKEMGVPSFCLDTPWRKDEAGYAYGTENLKECYEWLQKVLGRKHDPDKFAEIIDRSNECGDLLTKITGFRKLKPCPLPSRLLLVNGLAGSIQGSENLLIYLRKLYKISKDLADKGAKVTPGEEKYRVIWLQHMIWSCASVMDWMEKEFNAVSVIDAFGHTGWEPLDDPYDYDKLFRWLYVKCMNYPMIHGASGPASNYLAQTERFAKEYGANVAFFAGHVGCKHTWAVNKIVKDNIERKFHIPCLTFDLDSTDLRYKSVDDIKATIREFFETLEAGK